MSSIRIRPRFKILIDKDPEEIIRMITDSMKNGKSDFFVESLLNSFLVIKIKESNQHVWSPHLTISIEKKETGCVIRGLYGPKQTIWSLFMFLYTGIGVGILFAGLYGLARQSLNLEAPILWLVPILFGLALFLYLLAQLGQKLSAQQMFDIHHFIEKSIDRKLRIY